MTKKKKMSSKNETSYSIKKKHYLSYLYDPFDNKKHKNKN